jgi:homoserine dehydrogenase
MSALHVPSLVERKPLPALGIGLLGCGVVGSAVARRLLATRPDLLRGIAVKDPTKTREVAWEAWGADPFAVVDDPSVGIVVECIGGVRLARELVLRAIAHGKDVVTANKELIAIDGPWLAAFAARTGATLHYEAAVGGAIPILRALESSLVDETIGEIGGIVNGTTNFVLSQMEAGADYAVALAEAQRRGFAEADPRNDVDGHDAAHKLTILATLAFRRPVALDAVHRSGIAGVTADDVALARERGWRVKLVALARRSATGFEAGVSPMFVAGDHPFARPSGAENVVRLTGSGCGPLEFFGLGAGGDASASSVVGDVVAAVDARAHGSFVRRRAMGDPAAVVPLRLPVVLRGARGVEVAPPTALDDIAALAARSGARSAIPLLAPG